ncbi:hypothetical protein GQR58_019228 [Nymphon striatum]|nr:hypothetical protein GQR58_019228 [Nymphon striatum]
MDAIDTIKILGSLLGNGGLSKGSGGNVLGNILGSALGGAQNQQTQGGGALGDILGSLIGGGQQSTQGGSMADVLGGLLGGGGGRPQQVPGGLGGGLGDILGSLVGGGQAQQQQRQAPSGGMGDLLGGLLGGGSQNNAGLGGDAGLGGLLSSALTKYAQSQNTEAPNPPADRYEHLPQGMDQAVAVDQATLIIRAMINASKSDGSIDREEQEKVIGKLGDVTQAEVDFVRNEFNAPLDVDAFIDSIPRGMEQQIYAVSLMAIDLDTNKEARYLHQLAKGLRIQPELANQIHEQLGAQTIFS